VGGSQVRSQFTGSSTVEPGARYSGTMSTARAVGVKFCDTPATSEPTAPWKRLIPVISPRWFSATTTSLPGSTSAKV